MISESLQRFIRERLSSLEQIEIVLLLRSDPSRSWTAPEVAASLGTPPESTAMRLFLLASNGFIVFEGGGIPRYRYGCADPEADARIAELADVYAADRRAISSMVEGPRDPLQSFADAFKLKK